MLVGARREGRDDHRDGGDACVPIFEIDVAMPFCELHRARQDALEPDLFGIRLDVGARAVHGYRMLA